MTRSREAVPSIQEVAALEAREQPGFPGWAKPEANIPTGERYGLRRTLGRRSGWRGGILGEAIRDRVESPNRTDPPGHHLHVIKERTRWGRPVSRWQERATHGLDGLGAEVGVSPRGPFYIPTEPAIGAEVDASPRGPFYVVEPNLKGLGETMQRYVNVPGSQSFATVLEPGGAAVGLPGLSAANVGVIGAEDEQIVDGITGAGKVRVGRRQFRELLAQWDFIPKDGQVSIMRVLTPKQRELLARLLKSRGTRQIRKRGTGVGFRRTVKPFEQVIRDRQGNPLFIARRVRVGNAWVTRRVPLTRRITPESDVTIIHPTFRYTRPNRRPVVITSPVFLPKKTNFWVVDPRAMRS